MGKCQGWQQRWGGLLFFRPCTTEGGAVWWAFSFSPAMSSLDAVKALIPHRPPFLFVDEIVSEGADGLVAKRTWRAEENFYEGHYPGAPITPGVLLCEAVFQAGAVLLGELLRQEPEAGGGAVPVLTRILGARFKREVRPGDRLEIRAALVERMGPAWMMKGSVRVGGKVAVQVEFACARREG